MSFVLPTDLRPISSRPTMRTLLQAVVSLSLCATTHLCRADSFYELLRYRCSAAADRLQVEYVGAYNEEGVRLFASRTLDDVNPWDLIVMEKADEPKLIVGTKSEHRTCKLSDGEYLVELSASPCNFNVHGLNGAMMMARAEVRLPGHRVAKAEFGGCTVEGHVNTKLIIRSGGKSRVEKMKAEEYFR